MIDLMQCELSEWHGDKRRCNFCDTPLSGRRRSWCSRECYQEFTRTHHYGTSRTRCLIAARAKCGCPEVAFIARVIDKETGGYKHRRRTKHSVCAKCRKCSVEVGPLECDHITPRLGNKDSYSCLHHPTNLRMLCHSCHAEVTQLQRALWPKRRSKAELTLVGKAPAERKPITPKRKRKAKPVRRKRAA